eukprot:GHVP01059344.1.p2 GENE.GHVP01059344.1~~GHVP01059344.1.p2  ORF type:complete len:123 (+),score=21.63 GHVP01059344.1:895-1263(+)
MAGQKPTIEDKFSELSSKDFIKSNFLSITDEIVEIVGIDGFKNIYQLENIEDIFALSKQAFNEESSMSTGIIEARMEDLNIRWMEKKSELSKVVSFKFDVLMKIRSILRDSLESSKDKREIT